MTSREPIGKSENPSLWVEVLESVHAPSLAGDIEADVVVVGGGIAGVTTALLLAQAGKRVALLEMDRIGHGTTGSTTAHLTEAVDTRYFELEKDFGKDGAKLVAAASRSALSTLEQLVTQHHIACDWRQLPGYLYSENERDLHMLHREYEAAQRAGLAVEMTREVPLPFATRAAVVFANQAEFHIGKYLNGLVKQLRALNVQIFEGSRVTAIEESASPVVVRTEYGSVKAPHVVVTTNNPLSFLFLQTKVHSYRSYVVAARVPGPQLPGLFWDTDDPYHYLRSSPVHDGGAGSFLVIGGEDHKTGTEEDTEARYGTLIDYATERFGKLEITHRWSAQVLEPVDGLPYIGPSSESDSVFYATGFSGNGMTFGTVAAQIISDAILGRPNALAEVFDARRVHLLASAKELISENVDVPVHLIGDRIRPADAKSVDDVAVGEGKITSVAGKKCAVFRHEDGHLSVLSPVCTHLGCHVHFNDAEKTWDCPCHGSRFDVEGTVIDGPATIDLARIETSETDEEASA